MKKAFKILCLCLACLVILAGCELPLREYSADGITFRLPMNFQDVFEEGEDMGDLEFYFANRDIAITGLHESKESVWEFYPDMTAKEYAQIMRDSMDADGELLQKDGLWYYTYIQQLEEGVSDTGIVVIHETEKSFWMIQANCYSNIYMKNQDTVWSYIAQPVLTE